MTMLPSVGCMNDIPEIRCNGVTFRLPFWRLLRPLTALEFARLDASIVKNRVQERAITYTSPLWGERCVIQGSYRLRICGERDIFCPVCPRDGMTDDAAREMRLELATTGRRLTPEEIEQLRENRDENILQDRGLGESLRSIAARYHLSVRMVGKILRAAGVDRSTPETIEGRDGKQYPAPVPLPPFDTNLASGQRNLIRLRAILDQLSAAERRQQFDVVCRRHGGPGEVERALALLDAVLADLASGVMGAEVGVVPSCP